MARNASKNLEHVRKLIESLTSFKHGSENFTLCEQFVLSNILYHRYLDITPNDVREKLERSEERFFVNSYSTTLKKLNQLTNKFFQLASLEPSKSENLYGVLYLLLILAGRPTCSDNVIFDDASISEENDIIKELLVSEDDLDCTLVPNNSQCKQSQSEPSTEDELEGDGNPLCQSKGPIPDDTDSGVDISPQEAVAAPRTDESVIDAREWFEKKVVSPYWKKSHSLSSIPFHPQIPVFIAEFTITERQLIFELLWLVQGADGLVAFQWNGRNYDVVEGLRLFNVSQTALAFMLRPACHYGTVVKQLKSFVSATIESLESSQTYQAYATTLNVIVNKVLMDVSQLEAKLRKQDCCASMQEMLQEIEHLLSDLDHVYFVHTQGVDCVKEDTTNWEKSSTLISCLRKHLIEVDAVVYSTKVVTLLILFIGTIKPLLDFIEAFVTKAFTMDPAQEFFIIRKEGIVKDETYWNNSLALRGIPENFFLKGISSSVLLAGKSMEIVASFGTMDDYKGHLFNHFEENLWKSLAGNGATIGTETPRILSAKSNVVQSHFREMLAKRNFLLEENFLDFFSSSEESETALDRSESNFRGMLNAKVGSVFPLQFCIEGSLFPLVEDLCKEANGKLLATLRGHHLIDHLDVLRKYFLMESGDIMFYFSSHLFKKLSSGEELDDLYFLNNLIQEAIAQFHAHSTSNSLHLDLRSDLPHSKRPKLLQELAKVNLCYEVPWPANIILNSECIDVHQQIFTFLLQIKCVKCALDELFLTDLEKIQVTADDEQLMFFEKPEKMPEELKRRVMFLLRMKFLHFINSLHAHFMIHILHSMNAELQKKVDQATDFQEIQLEYKAYLKKLRDLCLLQGSHRILRESIFKILAICFRFAALWKKGIRAATASHLFAIDDTFNKYHNFLSSVIGMLRKRSSFHLDCLSFALLCQEKAPPIVPKECEATFLNFTRVDE